jgi:hypothetical protein
MKIHPIFVTLLGSVIVVASADAAAPVKRANEQQRAGGGGVRRRKNNPNRLVANDEKKSQILEDAAAQQQQQQQQQDSQQYDTLPSDFPSMSPIAGQAQEEQMQDAQETLPSDFPSMSPISMASDPSSPADDEAAAPVVAIKECNDTSTADIRFVNHAGLEMFASCSDIVDNDWQDVACPQGNANIYAQGAMIYETCGNECQQLSGCGLPITAAPSSTPSSSPSAAPTSSPTRPIKVCDNNANVRFVVTVPTSNVTVVGQCSEISNNHWQDELCLLINERVVYSPGVVLYEICGYECQELSGCGLPAAL